MQVLLPLKEFAAAKQRLAGVLSAPERAQLFEAMVDDVLNVLTAHPAIEQVVICSRDRAAVWLARYYEVEFWHEDQLCEQYGHAQNWRVNDPLCGGLNGVVNAAAERFAARGVSDLMVVHGDLPLLSESDISSFIASHFAAGDVTADIGAQSRAALTIAPDRRRSGTNLLAWRGLADFTACYGIDSFQQHTSQARAHHAALTVCDLPGARCDIDEPEDLLLLAQNTQPVAVRTMAYLRSSGVAARLAAMALPPSNDRNVRDEQQC
jgi:2-phospho-L-lactate/phosphoenolpyruvate guanylyltransferase